MDPVAAKYIGAGIACIGMGGAGVGVGTIFGHYLAAALRNPSAAAGQFGNLIFGFAVTEALGIFSLADRVPPALRRVRRIGLATMSRIITKVVAAAGLALAAGGAWAAESGGHKFPPLQSETYASQIFWLAIIFVALYLLMSRIALPRVGEIIATRQQHVDADLAEARRLKDDSDAAIAAYEKALADARGRAQALANETREKYAAEAETARKALDATLNARIAEAERTIAARRTAAMANVQGIAVETATAIVERLTGNAPSGGDVAKAVADDVQALRIATMFTAEFWVAVAFFVFLGILALCGRPQVHPRRARPAQRQDQGGARRGAPSEGRGQGAAR